MTRKPFGGTGVAVPVIGQGTWDIPESGHRRAEAQGKARPMVVVMLACQVALFLQAFAPVSWWDGP